MIGYKVAKNGDTRVIVTLEIPEDALTNMGRSSIVVMETAKYRTNKAKVLSVEDASGISYESAHSSSYEKKSLTYKVGETVEEPSYDPDPEQVYAEGIHYFLSLSVTAHYDLETVENGLLEQWHDNGHKASEFLFVDRKLHGLSTKWFDNGQKWRKANYTEGKLHGTYEEWHPNGQKNIVSTHINGKGHGAFNVFYPNGQKLNEANYVDGKLDGHYMEWYSNGRKYTERSYKKGKLHGLCQIWFEDGRKKRESMFVEGEETKCFYIDSRQEGRCQII